MAVHKSNRWSLEEHAVQHGPFLPQLLVLVVGLALVAYVAGL